VTFTDAFAVVFTEVFDAGVADTFVVTVVPVFVGTAVAVAGVADGVGTGVAVWIVIMVVGRAPESRLPGAAAGVSFDAGLVPGSIPEKNAATTTSRMTAAPARRPHFRRGLRLFSCSGPLLPSSGMAATGVLPVVVAGPGCESSREVAKGTTAVLSG
jgi:hypothetical protein